MSGRIVALAQNNTQIRGKRMIQQHIEENHFSQRMNGLRAAVLGANDGIISVVSC